MRIDVKSPAFWIATGSLGLVVLMALVDLRRTAPGPITAVHAQSAALDGDSSCSDCHGGWFQSMTEACDECHAAVAKDVEERTHFHGAMPKELGAQCATCHMEHHGAGFAIVNKQSFARAGAPGPDGFDHRFVGFEMDGKHLELDCSKCHANADVVVLAKDATRYGGLDQDCAACHEDVHEGRMVVACASCHGQTDWKELHSLGHEKFLPLVGGHGDLDCRKCHAESTPRSLEALGGHGGAARRETPRSCTDCHASPHDVAFVAESAKQAEKTPSTTCVVCHAAEHTSFRDERMAMTPAQHAASGFALDAPHDAPKCADCHAPDAKDFHERYPGRKSGDCSACHEDVHRGQFAEGPFAGQECTACHDHLRWTPHAFTTEKHVLAALPLEQTHATTECNACHVDPKEGEPRVFHGTKNRCEDCHADAHAGFFAPFFAERAAPKQGECAQCHDASTFASLPHPTPHVQGGGFDHDAWTDFPVRGAHAESACEACHRPNETPDDKGRRFGRVEQQFGPFTGCVTCHADPHRGGFDSAELPKDVDGRTDCARCHVESSFRSFPRGFDHATWTGFALEDAHASVACSGCHAQMRTPDELGRNWGRARGELCSDCHADPHAGQFAVAGVVDCARCHTSDAKSFLDFDHERDARFALGQQHKKVACSACHETVQVGGEEVVRYRPLPRECADCHGANEDVLLRRTSRRNP